MPIDFTNCPVRNKTYAGANGSKISVIYDGHLYMLKFPSAAALNKDMSMPTDVYPNISAVIFSKRSAFRFRKPCSERIQRTERRRSWSPAAISLHPA